MSYTINDECNGCRLCVKVCPVSAISGEKKQLHVIDQTKCVDCGACGKVCKPGAVLDTAGTVCLRIKKSAWPKPVFDLKACTACTACYSACPVNVIELSLQKKKDKNLYPALTEPKQCISCSFCFEICSSGAITMQAPVDAAA